MTTSGSISYNPQVLYLATRALRLVGAIQEGESPSASMLSDTLDTLNAIVKEWQATGLHVWAEEEAILFLQQGQVRYLLGGASTDNACDAFSYSSPTLALGAGAGASSVQVSSISGLASGMFFGVTLDSGATFWTTLSGAPSGSSVALSAPLPSSASSGNYVFAYASRIQRPLKVPKGRLFYFSGSREVPMRVLSRQEYMDLPQKLSPGATTQFFYTPKLDSGQLFVYLDPQTAASAGATGMRFTWYRELFDFADQTNTLDAPQEWINALVWNGALEMAVEFDVPPQRFAILKTQAAEKLDLVASYDRESEDVQFGMDYAMQGRV